MTTDPAWQWLTLTAASELLGVHPMTLRGWVDAGVIRAYRTPGGHRRLRRDEVEQFLEQQRAVVPTRALTVGADQALQEIRAQLHSDPVMQSPWYARLSDAQRAQHRQLGQRLLGLLLQYVSRRENAQHFLDQAQELARAYGCEIAQAQMPPGELARAFLFFRRSILQATHHPDGSSAQGDAEGLRLLQRINAFMDELLIVTLDAYDETNRRTVTAPPVMINKVTRARTRRGRRSKASRR